MEQIGKRATKGAIWASLDKFCMMGLQFVVNLILARLLLPADFGAIGILAIFIAVSTVLIDGGFGSALIQKKLPSQKDYSTIFYWNLFFSTVLYCLLFISAPIVAQYFRISILSTVLRVIGINLIFNSIQTVQRVRLQKSLAFKNLALTNICAYILGSGVGIFMAYNNAGVWSLVFMQIVCSVFGVFMLYMITKWHPSICFSTQSWKELFSFGGYMMAASILQEICKNLQGIIIGKKFSATEMGLYSQAYKLDRIISYSIPQVIVQVMYPVYSSIQDERKRLNEMVLMNMRVVSYIVFPILTFLLIVAKPLILALYGDHWLASVPYFQVLCIGGYFVCLQNINFYAVAAIGKSKSLFRWSFYKWGFLLLALLIGMNFGMYGILWGINISNLNIFLVNVFLASKHNNLSIRNQLNTLMPIVCVLLVGLLISLGLQYCGVNVIVSGILLIITFVILSISFKLRAYSDFLWVLKKLIKRKV